MTLTLNVRSARLPDIAGTGESFDLEPVLDGLLTSGAYRNGVVPAAPTPGGTGFDANRAALEVTVGPDPVGHLWAAVCARYSGAVSINLHSAIGFDVHIVFDRAAVAAHIVSNYRQRLNIETLRQLAYVIVARPDTDADLFDESSSEDDRITSALNSLLVDDDINATYGPWATLVRLLDPDVVEDRIRPAGLTLAGLDDPMPCPDCDTDLTKLPDDAEAWACSHCGTVAAADEVTLRQLVARKNAGGDCSSNESATIKSLLPVAEGSEVFDAVVHAYSAEADEWQQQLAEDAADKLDLTIEQATALVGAAMAAGDPASRLEAFGYTSGPDPEDDLAEWATRVIDPNADLGQFAGLDLAGVRAKGEPLSTSGTKPEWLAMLEEAAASVNRTGQNPDPSAAGSDDTSDAPQVRAALHAKRLGAPVPDVGTVEFDAAGWLAHLVANEPQVFAQLEADGWANGDIDRCVGWACRTNEDVERFVRAVVDLGMMATLDIDTAAAQRWADSHPSPRATRPSPVTVRVPAVWVSLLAHGRFTTSDEGIFDRLGRDVADSAAADAASPLCRTNDMRAAGLDPDSFSSPLLLLASNDREYGVALMLGGDSTGVSDLGQALALTDTEGRTHVVQVELEWPTENQRAAAMDAVKRVAGISNRQAATAVDRPAAAAELHQDAREVIVAAATGEQHAEAVAAAIRALAGDRYRAEVALGSDVAAATLELLDAGTGEGLALISGLDWANMTAVWADGSAVDTGLPAHGGPDSIRVARRLIQLLDQAG